MTQKKRILEIIYYAIEKTNEYLPDEEKLTKASDTPLFGEDAKLDSLGLVDLIVATEQRIEDVLDITMAIADEKAVSEDNSPFRSVDTLADYIMKLLAARG